MTEAPQLLKNMPDDVVMLPETYPTGQQPTIDLICRAVAYDKSKKVLRINAHVFLRNIAQGKTTLNEYNKNKARKLISVLVTKGFELPPTH